MQNKNSNMENLSTDQKSSENIGSTPNGPQAVDVAGAAAEVDLWVGHTDWKHYLGSIFLVVAWSLFTLFVCFSKGGQLGWWLTIFCIMLWIITLCRIVYHILSERYRLTNQRLFMERGLLSRTIDQTELIRVDDVRVFQSLMDRVVGLGTVEIISTDQSDRKIKIIGVNQPSKLADIVRQNMRKMRAKSLFVESI